MSSASPITVDVNVVGNGWPAWLVVHSLLERNVSCAIEGPVASDRARIGSSGNGDPLEIARKVMGRAVADRLWKVGAVNRERALSLGTALGIHPAVWSCDGKEQPAFGFHGGELALRLERLCKTALRGPARATMTVYVCDTRAAVAEFASLSDKLIPVTLTYLETKTASVQWKQTSYHSGADYRIDSPKGACFGSYRNLFEDRAVGFLAADSVTVQGLKGFFPDAALAQVRVGYETLSCDGLPVVGALSETPTAFVVDGFAGRPENYLFAIADMLAEGISGLGSFDPLALFSTKRFV